jgi:hypothetical protein
VDFNELLEVEGVKDALDSFRGERGMEKGDYEKSDIFVRLRFSFVNMMGGKK